MYPTKSPIATAKSPVAAAGANNGSSGNHTTNQYARDRQMGPTENSNGSGRNPPAELQRRESLVKPTWANISQVPSLRFDELVMQQEVVDRGCVVQGDTTSELGMLSNKLLSKNGMSQKRREVELYDIFGKVREIIKSAWVIISGPFNEIEFLFSKVVLGTIIPPPFRDY